MPRKTTFKKIGRSKQGKSSSDFALEELEPDTFEFDIDTMTSIADTKQKKLVNPMTHFLISFSSKSFFSNLYTFKENKSKSENDHWIPKK